MFNPSKLLKLKNAWEAFAKNHPKFPLFMKAVQQSGLEEGTIIEIKITNPNGKTLNTNVKLTASDKELFKNLSDITNG